MKTKIKVIQPVGIFDGIRAVEFCHEINESLGHHVKLIVIDFRNVTLMDSSGLGALVSSLKAVKAAGVKLFLCSINEQISMLFELTNMDQVFEVFSSREELEQTMKSLGKP